MRQVAEIAPVGIHHVETVAGRIVDRFGLGLFDSQRAAAQVNRHSVRAAEKGQPGARGAGDEHTSREHHVFESTPANWGQT